MKCEHANWQLFVKHCIENGADPELVDSQLKSVNVAARARILSLSTQSDAVVRS